MSQGFVNSIMSSKTESSAPARDLEWLKLRTSSSNSKLGNSPSDASQSAASASQTKSTWGASNSIDSLKNEVRNKLSVSLPKPVENAFKNGRANTFATLVQGWENYMNGKTPDPLDPDGLPHPLAPPALRHTHSTPAQYNTLASVYENHPNQSNDDKNLPPPIELNPFQRSTSTPSAFRRHSDYSAFGKVEGSSAFTLPSQRYSRIPSINSESGSAFGPVQFYSMALEDMERTSIEVEDVTSRSQNDASKKKAGTKRGAAFRAARFLSDVRVLRRRLRSRGGRENPAQPASVSSSSKSHLEEDDEETTAPLDTSVTVITETEHKARDSSFLSGNSGTSKARKGASRMAVIDTAKGVKKDKHENETSEIKGIVSSQSGEYEQLDSDAEEEVSGYQPMESQLQPDSIPVPPPSYQNLVEERTVQSGTKQEPYVLERAPEDGTPKSNSSTKLRFTMTEDTIDAASPSPTRMLRSELYCLTPRSQSSSTTSPQTTRSSVTGSSSGHTTQATNVTGSTGLQSGLSTISETDREVMRVNKDGKRRRGLDRLRISRKSGTDNSSSNSTSSNSTNPHRYFSLASSPVNLRDGANAPLDRLLAESADRRSHRTAPISRSQTSNTSTSSCANTSTASESVSLAFTTSSASSSVKPPTFVSYLDRAASSDLTSFREATETSSQRGAGTQVEEREASPAAEMLGYSDLPYEELTASSQQVRTFRLERFRSRQRIPRPTTRSARPLKTPPPPGSNSPHQLHSPPQIVASPGSGISRPYVRRSANYHSSLTSRRSPFEYSRSMSPIINVHDDASFGETEILKKSQTYKESSIEVMDTTSFNDDVGATVITPEAANHCQMLF